jgi:hypothetical protein
MAFSKNIGTDASILGLGVSMLRLLVSKWFYDISIGAAIRATIHCGSFIGKGFSLLIISYGWTW